MKPNSRTAFHGLLFSCPERRKLWLVGLQGDLNPLTSMVSLSGGENFNKTAEQKQNWNVHHGRLNTIAVPHVGPVAYRTPEVVRKVLNSPSKYDNIITLTSFSFIWHQSLFWLTLFVANDILLPVGPIVPKSINQSCLKCSIAIKMVWEHFWEKTSIHW